MHKHTAYNIIFDEEREEIAGAHTLNFDAEELVHICSLAIRAKVKTYPTGASELEYML